MRPWLIMFGAGLASIGLQAVQAQVTIDITKLTCDDFLNDRLTGTNPLTVWLNGYVNGERGKTLIQPISAERADLVHYCEDHNGTLLLDAARNVFSADK
jgi:acid stress chaperone HdeB